MQDMKTGGNGYCLMMYFGRSSQVLESIDRRDCSHHNETNKTSATISTSHRMGHRTQ